MRIGFLGVGWIGRARMQAALDTGCVAEAIVCEPAADARGAALALAPHATIVDSYEALLARRPDGVVIATPSAQHAEQAIGALRAGAAVFCQKPVGRTADEVASVAAAARAVDRLFEADFSYRRTAAMTRIRDLVRRGDLGRLFCADLAFHNAYGPDKDWFYDRRLSGGGCLMDLGVHLIDLVMWMFESGSLEVVASDLRLHGAAVCCADADVEDFAMAHLRTDCGAAVRIACSWRLPIGMDARIRAAWYGTQGGAAFQNLGGSFYDFQAERFDGVKTTLLAAPPDAWGGRAIAAWIHRLHAGARYSADAEMYVRVARIVENIYSHARSRQPTPHPGRSQCKR